MLMGALVPLNPSQTFTCEIHLVVGSNTVSELYGVPSCWFISNHVHHKSKLAPQHLQLRLFSSSRRVKKISDTSRYLQCIPAWVLQILQAWLSSFELMESSPLEARSDNIWDRLPFPIMFKIRSTIVSYIRYIISSTVILSFSSHHLMAHFVVKSHGYAAHVGRAWLRHSPRKSHSSPVSI